MTEDKEKNTLIIQTSRFGDLEVPQSSIIEFANGLIGFSNVTKLVMLDYNPPFSWLQSVNIPELAYVVVSGAEFGDQYKFPLPNKDPYLDIQEEDEIAIIILVSVRPPPADTTANLKAPLIVNLRNNHGVQIILDGPQFQMRFPLWAKDAEENKNSTEE